MSRGRSDSYPEREASPAGGRRARRRRRSVADRSARARAWLGVVLAVALWVGAAAAAIVAWRVYTASPSVKSGAPVGTPTVERTIAPVDSEAFGQPTGVAVSGDRIYVADSRKAAVYVYSRAGSRVATIGAGELTTPVYVAVGPLDGRVYVVDRGRNEVVVYGADGKMRRVLDPRGSEPDSSTPVTPWHPLSLGFAPDGTMYVADVGGDQSVVEFSPMGVRLATIGAGLPLGRTGRRLSFPNGIAASDDGLVVADSNNSRLLFLSPDGSVRNIVSVGGLPRGAAALSDGRVLVVDAALHAIRVFSASGAELQQTGGFGSGPGQFAFPAGVAVDGDGRVYVADTGNSRLMIVRIPGIRPVASLRRGAFQPWIATGAALALVAFVVSLWLYLARRSSDGHDVAEPEEL